MIKSCPSTHLRVLRVASLSQVQEIMRSEVGFISVTNLIDWHLVKKKISSKINVQRPDEEFLLKYKDIHTPVVNYSEDHILNSVRKKYKRRLF
jgi:hypothetical protein